MYAQGVYRDAAAKLDETIKAKPVESFKWAEPLVQFWSRSGKLSVFTVKACTVIVRIS